ncbi:MAG TPA: DUF4272 domain-containing protein [Symbiobacteriaceae bacterium]|nr:DUF4272 domain-containing protein [Symbiobacteriaceae bacterium]
MLAPTAHFIQGAELRPVSEILDEADLIYRIHWAVRENQLRARLWCLNAIVPSAATPVATLGLFF